MRFSAARRGPTSAPSKRTQSSTLLNSGRIIAVTIALGGHGVISLANFKPGYSNRSSRPGRTSGCAVAADGLSRIDMHVREQRRRSDTAWMHRRCRAACPAGKRAFFWALTAVVLLSPLPFGGDRPSGQPAVHGDRRAGAGLDARRLACRRDGDSLLEPLLPAAMLSPPRSPGPALQGASFLAGLAAPSHLGPGARGAGCRWPARSVATRRPGAAFRCLPTARVFWLGFRLCRPVPRPAGAAGTDARRAGYASYGLYAFLAGPGP